MKSSLGGKECTCKTTDDACSIESASVDRFLSGGGFQDCNVPVHDGQEPEGPKAIVTGTCTGASRDILWRAKPLDLCPLSHMECHRVKSTINQGYGYDVKGVGSVLEGLLVDPC